MDKEEYKLMEDKQKDIDLTRILLNSLHNRLKAGIVGIPSFEVTEYKNSSPNGCKSKKELRAWVQLQNERRKAETNGV